MTKTNKHVIRDFIRSSWFGQNMISHNVNLIVAHNILFSHNIPLCVYERHTKYPFKIRNLAGKHEPHVKQLVDELRTISNASWEVLSGKLKVSGNDNDSRRKVISRDGNMPYEA